MLLSASWIWIRGWAWASTGTPSATVFVAQLQTWTQPLSHAAASTFFAGSRPGHARSWNALHFRQWLRILHAWCVNRDQTACVACQQLHQQLCALATGCLDLP